MNNTIQVSKIKLGEVAIINPKIQLPTDHNLKVGFISMADVSNDSKIMNVQERGLGEVNKGFTKFLRGDVLFAKITPCMENGKGGICLDDKYSNYFGSTEFHVLRASTKILPLYLNYVVNNTEFRKLAERQMTGSAGQKRVPSDFLKEYEFLLPSIDSQDIISKLLLSVEDEIATTDQILQKSERLKSGLMQKLFSADNNNWKEQKLGEATTFIDYRGKTPKKTVDGVPLITAKNVRMGFVDPNPREYINPDDYNSWMTRGIPRLGDVLITTEAPLGNIAQLEIDGKVAFAQRVIIIQTKPYLDSTFLRYLLMSDDLQGRIASLGTGGTVKGIKAKVLKQISIPIPSMPEQNKISSILSAIDQKISNDKDYRKTLFVLKNELMNDIFSRKVEVN